MPVFLVGGACGALAMAALLRVLSSNRQGQQQQQMGYSLLA
jgi:hypothetical protein